jgi:hypothetical protein
MTIIWGSGRALDLLVSSALEMRLEDLMHVKYLTGRMERTWFGIHWICSVNQNESNKWKRIPISFRREGSFFHGNNFL